MTTSVAKLSVLNVPIEARTSLNISTYGEETQNYRASTSKGLQED